MRIRSNQSAADQGTVLAVTMVLCGILGLMITSYLGMVKTQHFSVARAQSWNSAIVVAEAGVEEAMAHLNSSGVTTNNLAINSWVSLGGGIYSKTNSLGTSSYVTYIKIAPAVTNPYPVIVSTGNVAAPIALGTLARAIQVNTKPKPSQGVSGAMIVATTVNF